MPVAASGSTLNDMRFYLSLFTPLSGLIETASRDVSRKKLHRQSRETERMLQTIRSRVVEGWRSLPLPVSAPTPSFMQQSTVESTSSLREMDSPSGWSTPIKYRPSAFAKSRELGRLDPNLYLSETNEDLYDVPIDHLGRVWFTISYYETAEQLRITIHKARNLRSPRYQSFRSSSAIISNDMTSLSLLTPAPSQDCRIRKVLHTLSYSVFT
ncbi:synaptotagmin XV-a [Echinococcus granulosus]|uniref:Synaptotagmin XV-a n=1 Tax=Echinococcus granulosus TaxID=6210 RepID=W6UES8_ECHGR|nr:synaptotagmin XV-a [Echinococcus granulosus]EUB56612.1 synaptotagmin XV-a [Echinococcus granulosus]